MWITDLTCCSACFCFCVLFFPPPLYSFKLYPLSLICRHSFSSADETRCSLSVRLSQQKAIQTGQMDREARRIGRSLVRNEDEFGEGDDYDDDLMDLEAADVVLSPLLRSDLLLGHLLYPGILYVVKLMRCQCSVCSRFMPISVSVAAATPKIQSFQVRPLIFLTLSLWALNCLQKKQASPDNMEDLILKIPFRSSGCVSVLLLLKVWNVIENTLSQAIFLSCSTKTAHSLVFLWDKKIFWLKCTYWHCVKDWGWCDLVWMFTVHNSTLCVGVCVCVHVSR